VSPEDDKAFKKLKAELKAAHRKIALHKEELDRIKRGDTSGLREVYEASRGALERWVRSRKGTVIITVSSQNHPAGDIGVSISHGFAEIHGSGMTLDEAFEDGMRRAVEAVKAKADKELADLG